MTYIPDLSPCTYFDNGYRAAWSGVLTAVGWLEPWEPCTRGPVAPTFREKLGALLTKPWAPTFYLGFHCCGSCVARAEGLPFFRESQAWDRYPHGTNNLFVPGERTVYVAPELIAHYIDHHGYQPPAAFREAVERCPPMRSEEYLARPRLLLGDLFEGMDAADRSCRASGE